MALDLIISLPLLKDDAPAWASTPRAMLWLDAHGLVGHMDLVSQPFATENGYVVTQLDGIGDTRNPVPWWGSSASGQARYGIQSDLSQEDGCLLYHQSFSGPEGFLVWEFNPVNGHYAFNGGEPNSYTPSRIGLAEAGVCTTPILLGAVPDRYLFSGFFPAPLGEHGRGVFSWPRDPAASQAWTPEFQVAGTNFNFYPGFQGLSASNIAGVCWIHGAWRESDITPYRCRLVKYDYVNRRVLFDTLLGPSGAAATNAIQRVWWSPALKVFVAVYPGNSLALYSDQVVPAAISTPVITPEGQAFRVTVTVLGDYNEPAAHIPVEWSVNPNEGAFSQLVTETDTNGVTSTLYHPPYGASGNHTVTATVDWSDAPVYIQQQSLVFTGVAPVLVSSQPIAFSPVQGLLTLAGEQPGVVVQ